MKFLVPNVSQHTAQLITFSFPMILPFVFLSFFSSILFFEWEWTFSLFCLFIFVFFQKKLDSTDEESSVWDSEENMFLVCVYNVSPDQPYTVFKAPVSSTAQDIITQVRYIFTIIHYAQCLSPKFFSYRMVLQNNMTKQCFLS